MKSSRKSISTFNLILVRLFGLCLFLSPLQTLNAQDSIQHKLRLSAGYFKIVNGANYINIRATSKIDKKTIRVPNLELIIFNEFNEEKVKLGTARTNMDGEGRFDFGGLRSLKPDSSLTYNLQAVFEGNDSYTKASTTVSFRDALIEAKLITEDSINYISAKLIDKSNDSLIADKSLRVQVVRLFKPLIIGEEINITDENGSILVPVENGIPGVDGNLTFEVVLDDSDDYGTVKALLNADIGTPIVEESTFDDRTMWAPRNKTPLFLLILPNLIILGMWIVIVYLIVNLYKILKAKA